MREGPHSARLIGTMGDQQPVVVKKHHCQSRSKGNRAKAEITVEESPI